MVCKNDQLWLYLAAAFVFVLSLAAASCCCDVSPPLPFVFTHAKKILSIRTHIHTYGRNVVGNDLVELDKITLEENFFNINC